MTRPRNIWMKLSVFGSLFGLTLFLPSNSYGIESTIQSSSSENWPHQTGFVVPNKWNHGKNFVTQSMLSTKGDIPAKFDWRTNTSLFPIRDQGSCGSCWAFSTAATLSDVIMIKDQQSKDISEQHMVSCDKHGWNCSGGFWAFDMYETEGLVYEKDLPYKATNGTCPATLPRNEKIANWAYVGKPVDLAPADEDLKRAIYEFGPISVAVNVTSAFQFYRGGVFSSCVPTTTKELNHAVNIVGWNDEGGYWIMRNSWGRSWGESGYMKIKYGCNGIGSAAAYVNYKPTCENQPVANAGQDFKIKLGESIKIGSLDLTGKDFSWYPTDTLDDPTSPTPTATPTESTIYTVTVKTECGIAASQMEIDLED
jgi:C1A family cysteine protease